MEFLSRRIIHTRGAGGRAWALLPLVAVLFILTPARGSEADPVREAAKSVLRVVMATQFDEEVQNADISQKGWCTLPRVDEDGDVVGYAFLFRHDSRTYVQNWTGSGYLISPKGHWVTNHHVVDKTVDLDEPAKARLFILVQLDPKCVILPVNVLWSNGEKDLAVMETAPPDGLTPLVFADPEFIAPNIPVRSIGFPGASDQMSVGRGYGDEDAYLSPKITGGTLSHLFRHRGEVRAWQHDAGISGGNSGGPLVNLCGQVVGTNAFGHVKWQIANGAISLGELFPDGQILPELRRFNIPYTMVRGRCEILPKTESPTWLYVSLGILAAIMAVLAAGLVHVKNMLKQGRHVPMLEGVMTQKILRPFIASAPEVKRDPDGTDWKKDINGRWYRFDAVHGVVYLDDQPADANTLRLKSAQGAEIVLPAGASTIIGSSKAKAQVVVESKYVSGAHAKLSNRDGTLMVEDLNSSNGTFIGDRRLTGTGKLWPGEVLRLTNQPGLAEYRLINTAGLKAGAWTALVTPRFLGAKAIAVSKEQPVTIGRTGGNSIDIGDDAVSTRHCVLSVTPDGRLELKDLGSLNGTFVEGRPDRIEQAFLEKGQVFYVANRVYSFSIGNVSE